MSQLKDAEYGEFDDHIQGGDNWALDFCSNGERTEETYPTKDLWTRSSKAWEEILALESIRDQRNTLVVAHNAINQGLLWTALGCDSSYFRKLPWPNCAVLELQWRRGQKQADRYRWIVPDPSPYVEASDAVRLLKRSEADNKYTL